ncbi:MAG: Nif3-like dinuclear metal center hexameric protein [Alicyclobacillus macrosporangiidus]|uniref:Nif3-like dinuclear metal center hexameric protein n=1 Tax=Alicyclobacillus macrosporangiidus TaxID=392015 RepID=UPI0026E98090|nr:Nif3-like dinuclear metal center hexameric protein [Alicyclobacillus macrosporangiidus]MCL6600464.1 Nif3-like dinuclear metal center hexameric protein [Alicyclobacillus macrosporangiidus]
MRPVCTVRDVIDIMNRIAPPELAMDRDVVGLQLGRLDKPVRSVWLALDPYPAVIDAAVASGADLLITHHAMLFRPIQRIDTGTARGRAIASALAHDLAVFNAHTNLDIAEGGVNDVLAERLGLTDCEVLERTRTEGLRKLVVFVPVSHHEAVLQAVCAAGAGHIGAYSHCTFNTEGTGTFLPLEGAQPFLGEVGRLERAAEVRLETVVPESKLEPVVRAMLEAHPYEEVAYDIYPLQLMGKVSGIGRVGRLFRPMPLRDFADHVRERLGLAHIRFSGDPELTVERVAVLGGSGGRFAASAIAKGAQVLVTSDCDHHTVAEAWQDGLAIVDATHAALERPVLDKIRERLARELPDGVSIEIADVPEDPFQWI